MAAYAPRIGTANVADRPTTPEDPNGGSSDRKHIAADRMCCACVRLATSEHDDVFYCGAHLRQYRAGNRIAIAERAVIAAAKAWADSVGGYRALHHDGALRDAVVELRKAARRR